MPSPSWVFKVCGLIEDKYFTDFGRERGKAVHKACALLAKGTLDLDSVDARIFGFVKAYELFIKESGFVPQEMETPIMSMTYLYGVTPDQIGNFDSMPGLIEIKSGQILHHHRFQTAAQALARWPNNYLNARRVAVQLRPDGSYAKEEHEDLDDFDNFLALLKSAMIKLDAGIVKLEEE